MHLCKWTGAQGTGDAQQVSGIVKLASASFSGRTRVVITPSRRQRGLKPPGVQSARCIKGRQVHPDPVRAVPVAVRVKKTTTQASCLFPRVASPPAWQTAGLVGGGFSLEASRYGLTERSGPPLRMPCLAAAFRAAAASSSGKHRSDVSTKVPLVFASLGRPLGGPLGDMQDPACRGCAGGDMYKGHQGRGSLVCLPHFFVAAARPLPPGAARLCVPQVSRGQAQRATLVGSGGIPVWNAGWGPSVKTPFVPTPSGSP